MHSIDRIKQQLRHTISLAVHSGLFIVLAYGTTLFADSPSDPAADLAPLLSAAPAGLGPVALPGLRSVPIGAATALRSVRPDLFIISDGRSSGLYLLPYLRTGEDDAPMFSPPRPLCFPFGEVPGTVYETDDGEIHSAWLVQKTLRFATFDRTTLVFNPSVTIAIDGLPSTPKNIAVFPSADGNLTLVFEVTGEIDPARSKITNASSPDWSPFDAAGISTAAFRYRYLVAADLPAGADRIHNIRPLTPNRRETYWGMTQVSPLSLGSDKTRGVITGSRLGTFSYYPSVDVKAPDLPARTLVANTKGIVLRHPSVGSGPVAYPSSSSGSSHFIAGGEGALYFYRNSGRFTDNDAPMFFDPVPLLQENAALYAGTLPTPSVIDWDGDGITDLIVGNSEGFILFFKNIVSNNTPSFLPGERLQAQGRDIHHQAGYSGSVQGTPEAHWGYVSPNAFDWNYDGLPDLVVGDITGNYVVYINRGTRTSPSLDAAHPLYCDGLNLHGTWRSRPAVGRIGDRIALILPDGEGDLRLYWKIDDYNVEDSGKLLLDDGSTIGTTYDPAGGTGRVKLDLYDVDRDGQLDLVIGTGRRGAIPNKETGYPLPTLGKRTLNTLLFMRNVGNSDRPVFAHPLAVAHSTHGIVQPGGSHESGFVGTHLGGGSLTNFIVTNEAGRLFLLRGENLRLLTHEEASTYHDKRNPFPASMPSTH